MAEIGIISSSETLAASFALALGSITVLIPNSFASIHIGNTPFILLTFPSKETSPINIVFTSLFTSMFGITPIAINIPSQNS